jgi:hypothetical protein
MALDATPGGASADSYLTVEEADAYFAARLHATTWAAATLGQKEAALKWATRLFDAKITAQWTQEALPADATIRVLSTLSKDQECFVVWNGQATTDTQALAWPRTGMLTKNGYPMADDVVPQQVKDAVCELATLLLVSDRTTENEAGAVGLTELSAGPVTLKFADPPPNPKLLPDFVFQLLVPSWWFCFTLERRIAARLEKV